MKLSTINKLPRPMFIINILNFNQVRKENLAFAKSLAQAKALVALILITLNFSLPYFTSSLKIYPFLSVQRFHTTFRLYEQEEQFQLTDVIKLHFIEMRKLLVHWKQNKLNPWDNTLARWLLLLGAVDKQEGKVYEDIYQELEAITMKDDVLKEAFDVWELLSADENKRLQYESRLKVALDEYAAKREAEIRLKMAK